MKRLTCPDDQTHLWPDEVMNSLAGHPKVREPLPPLPFERNEEVDAERAAKILATDRDTILRMRKEGKIDGYQIKTGRKSKPIHRIRKDSLLAYCDNLRLKYGISPRKPSIGRWPRDAEFLPFPADETTDMKEVMEHLDIIRSTALKLLDCGAITAYQLSGQPNTAYRIHRPSLAAYILSLRKQANV